MLPSRSDTELSTLFDEAERAGGAIPASGRPTGLSRAAGYAIQHERLAQWDVAPRAWKVGASNFTSQQAFATDEPFIGPIRPAYTQQVEQAEAAIDWPAHVAFQFEVEVALRTARALTEGDVLETLSDDALFSSAHLALEMPANRLGFKPTGDDLGLLVADHATSGAFIAGRALPLSVLAEVNQRFRSLVDTRVVAEAPLQALVASPVAIARRVLPVILAQCGTLPAGSYLSTGGITPCIAWGDATSFGAEWEGIDRLHIHRTGAL